MRTGKKYYNLVSTNTYKHQTDNKSFSKYKLSLVGLQLIYTDRIKRNKHETKTKMRLFLMQKYIWPVWTNQMFNQIN